MRLLVALFLSLLGPFAFDSDTAPGRFEFSEAHMGTRFRIVVYAGDSQAAIVASRAAFDRVAQLDAIMSDYNETSELMTVCRQSEPGKPLRIGADLFEVLQKGQWMSELSMGAFDVTAGPLVRLWRRTRRTGELPEPRRLEQALKLTGYKKIHLDPKNRSVTFDRSGVLLDLGGIAKGYAADQAMVVLKRFGVSAALIAAGGDILVSDPPPDSNGWVIGITPLQSSDLQPERYVVLKNQAVSTSGDVHQFVQIGADRYSHIIDPRTGLALKGPASVTVVAPDCVTSDSLATAVSVMGAERGGRLVESFPGASAIFVRKEADGMLVSATKRWRDTQEAKSVKVHLEDRNSNP